MSHKEYRIVHMLDGVAAPGLCSSLEEAKRLKTRAEEYALHWKIQVRTVTEWEDA